MFDDFHFHFDGNPAVAAMENGTPTYCSEVCCSSTLFKRKSNRLLAFINMKHERQCKRFWMNSIFHNRWEDIMLKEELGTMFLDLSLSLPSYNTSCIIHFTVPWLPCLVHRFLMDIAFHSILIDIVLKLSWYCLVLKTHFYCFPVHGCNTSSIISSLFVKIWDFPLSSN